MVPNLLMPELATKEARRARQTARNPRGPQRNNETRARRPEITSLTRRGKTRGPPRTSGRWPRCPTYKRRSRPQRSPKGARQTLRHPGGAQRDKQAGTKHPEDTSLRNKNDNKDTPTKTGNNKRTRVTPTARRQNQPYAERPNTLCRIQRRTTARTRRQRPGIPGGPGSHPHPFLKHHSQLAGASERHSIAGTPQARRTNPAQPPAHT